MRSASMRIAWCRICSSPRQAERTLDGVTGTISPARDHRFVRESVPAQFNQGETRTLSDPSGATERVMAA